MLITQQEIWKEYKISRTLLINWERDGILKKVVTLPSGHRRYVKSEILSVLGLAED